MKRKIVILGIFCIVGIVSSMWLWGNNFKVMDESDEEIMIGLSVDSFIIERWQRDSDIFVQEANRLGARVEVRDAYGDIERQISDINYFIDQGMDVITIVSIDSDALTEVVRRAKGEGVKIIAYDRLIKNADIDLYISFDNERVGELMAEALVQNSERSSGNILMISGPIKDHNVSLVNKGFMNVMSQHPSYEIEKVYVEQWLPERAFSITNGKINEMKQIDSIMCGNDGLAGEAIRALAEKRLAGQVAVVGQDADLEACQRIVEGVQTMTVYKPVDELAKKAATYAVELAKGNTIEVAETFFDGMYEVPYEKLEPIAVTKENIDEVIIESGFHSREEVYLNIYKSEEEQ